jgi:opacity protein-like surface antigen
MKRFTLALLAVALAAPAYAASLDDVAVDWSRRRGGGGHHRHYREHRETRVHYVPVQRQRRVIRARSLLVPMMLLGSDGNPQVCWLRDRRLLICP